MADLGKKSLRAWMRLHRAHDRVSREIEQRLQAADLPPYLWFQALRELDRADPAGLRPFEIQAALGEAQPAISRLLDRMAKAGFLEREVCADDRRGWRVALTEAGRAAKDRMAEIYTDALAEHFVGRLSDKQVKALDEILGDFLSGDARR